jgi:hypothetical protein
VRTAFSIKAISLCWVFIGWFTLLASGQGTLSATPPMLIELHERFADRFKAGDTNVPLLLMNWFAAWNYGCSVEKSGQVRFGGSGGLSNWGSPRASLSETNLRSLIETINHLPPPSDESLPYPRQIVISGIRSNQWFHGVYDRAKVPEQVEKLFEMTGVSLEWFVPQAKGYQYAHAVSGGFAAVARDVPIAVLKGQNFLEVQDLRESPPKLASLFQLLPYSFRVEPLGPVVLSTDGKLIVLAGHHGVVAMDWKESKQIWQMEHLEHEGNYRNALAIGGDKGQFLFTAGAHTIERWDLLTGRKLATLAVNGPLVKLLTTSRDGRVMLAGFNYDNHLGSLAKSFFVWEADQDQPTRRLIGPSLSAVGLSADGRRIALSGGREKKLVMYDWQADERKEVPLRLPYAGSCAYALYWAPDGKRVAAVVDGYPPSVFVYDSSTWKPIAQWSCLGMGEMPNFTFTKDGVLVQLRGAEINALDVVGLRGLEE